MCRESPCQTTELAGCTNSKSELRSSLRAWRTVSSELAAKSLAPLVVVGAAVVVVGAAVVVAGAAVVVAGGAGATVVGSGEPAVVAV